MRREGGAWRCTDRRCPAPLCGTAVLDLALRSVVADKFQGGVLTVVDDAVMEVRAATRHEARRLAPHHMLARPLAGPPARHPSVQTPSTLKLADIAKSQGWTDALLVGETRPREETKALHLSARGLEHLDYIQATVRAPVTPRARLRDPPPAARRRRAHLATAQAIDIYKLLFRKQLVLTRNAVDELTTRLAWV